MLDEAFIREHIDAIGLVLNAAAILVGVIAGLVGYGLSHLSALRRDQFRKRFDYVSVQLERLYGPLYSLVQSNDASWATFRKSFRPGANLFDPQRPFDAREVERWKAWAEHVFIPSNLKIRDVIEQNAHLVGARMPPEFVDALAHIESSKLVLVAVADGDLSLLDQFPPWPDAFNGYVEQSYERISAEHLRLLGLVSRSPRR